MSKHKTCDNCSLTWTRDHNVKDIVLCPLHAAAPVLLAALEAVTPHLPHLGPIFDNPDLECGPDCPRHRADAAIAQAKD